MAVGVFDIVSAETLPKFLSRTRRIRRYTREHVTGNRVDAGGTRAASGAPGDAYVYARAFARPSLNIRKTMQPPRHILFIEQRARARAWYGAAVRREGNKLSPPAAGSVPVKCDRPAIRVHS